jgi:hypothetical protein
MCNPLSIEMLASNKRLRERCRGFTGCYTPELFNHLLDCLDADGLLSAIDPVYTWSEDDQEPDKSNRGVRDADGVLLTPQGAQDALQDA